MQWYISNFKHLGQEVLKKKIFNYFPIGISMVQTRTPWPGAILDPGTFI